MRYFAVTLLLAAMGAAGYLAWTGLHQTPEVIPVSYTHLTLPTTPYV